MTSISAPDEAAELGPPLEIPGQENGDRAMSTGGNGDTQDIVLGQQQFYLQLWAERQQLFKQRKQTLEKWESSIYQHQRHHNTLARLLSEASEHTLTVSLLNDLRSVHGRLLADYGSHHIHLANMKRMQQDLQHAEQEIEAMERQALASIGDGAHSDLWDVRSFIEPSDSGDRYDLSYSIAQSRQSPPPIDSEVVDQYYIAIADVRVEIERIGVLIENHEEEIQELRSRQGTTPSELQALRHRRNALEDQWQKGLHEANARLDDAIAKAESALRSCSEDNVLRQIDEERILNQFVAYDERLQAMLSDQVQERIFCLRIKHVYQNQGPDIETWRLETHPNSYPESIGGNHGRPESRALGTEERTADVDYAGVAARWPADPRTRAQLHQQLHGGGSDRSRAAFWFNSRSEPSLPNFIRQQSNAM